MLIAGDIGGTKTDLAIYSQSEGLHAPLRQASVRSADYPSLETAALDFLAGGEYAVDAAVFGVAGPVVEGRATGANLPWMMDEGVIASVLGVGRVKLLNDLQAIANAVPFLNAEDLMTLNPGVPAPGGTLAVVAPGTGLGEAFLIMQDGHYVAHPSEGGHASFSPNSDREVALLSYLRRRYGHVSSERVCSGRWLINLYEFLRDEGHAIEPEWLAERIAAAADPTPVIVQAGLDEGRPCGIARMVLETFASILGGEAGNLALTVMATGGVYLGGGMPPRVLPAIRAGGLIQAFQSKGRLSYIVEAIPVHVILNARAGLMGAAGYGLENLLA
jgi:glucokinase